MVARRQNKKQERHDRERESRRRRRRHTKTIHPLFSFILKVGSTAHRGPTGCIPASSSSLVAPPPIGEVVFQCLHFLVMVRVGLQTLTQNPQTKESSTCSIALIGSHCLISNKPLWVISNHPAPGSVHKTELRQLSSNLIKCTFQNHLQNVFQEEVLWNGR
jgi:hypothetical protein